jgi:hypothetical protein
VRAEPHQTYKSLSVPVLVRRERGINIIVNVKKCAKTVHTKKGKQ